MIFASAARRAFSPCHATLLAAGYAAMLLLLPLNTILAPFMPPLFDYFSICRHAAITACHACCRNGYMRQLRDMLIRHDVALPHSRLPC